MIGNYFAKVLWEVLATPVKCKIVGYLSGSSKKIFTMSTRIFTPFFTRT